MSRNELDVPVDNIHKVVVYKMVLDKICDGHLEPSETGLILFCSECDYVREVES